MTSVVPQTATETWRLQPYMKRSALSSTPRRGGEGLGLLLLFLFPRDFAFGVAVACALPTKARLPIVWVGFSPTSHVFDPAARNHDSWFQLPCLPGRQGAHSLGRGWTSPHRLKPGLPCMRTGGAERLLVESAPPHPPQPHRQLARHRHRGNRAILLHGQPPIAPSQFGLAQGCDVRRSNSASNARLSPRRRSVHAGKGSARNCSCPCFVHSPGLRSIPSFVATALSWFFTRVRICTNRCRCSTSCRTSRCSAVGTQIRILSNCPLTGNAANAPAGCR